MTRELDRVAVYGRVGSTAIFELLAMADDADAGAPRPGSAAYEAGLAAYRARRWDEAIDAFENCRKTRPGGDQRLGDDDRSMPHAEGQPAAGGLGLPSP